MAVKEKQRGVPAQKNVVTTEIMDQIMDILCSTSHGNVTLVFQDSRLVQIERNEKIRPHDLNSGNKSKPIEAKENCDFAVLSTRILQALDKLEYGQVVISIKDNRIIQIDRTEKQRFSALVGIYGDGI
jgi:hypothetical protein